MQTYKIFSKSNYTYFQWTDITGKIFNKRYASFKLTYEKGEKTFNIFYNNIAIKFNPELTAGLKENGTPYTEVELENFLNDTTSSSGGSIGGGVAGDASALNQVNGNNILSSIDSKTPALVGGKVPIVLPTNASTELKQDVGNTSLGSIDSKIPIQVLGRLPVDIASIPIAVGASTENAQNTGNFTLGQINSTLLSQATSNNQIAGNNILGNIKTNTDNLDVPLSTRLKPSDTLSKVAILDTITNPLPIGSNIIGQVGIDQTTNGVTNRVNIGIDGQVSIRNAVGNGTGFDPIDKVLRTYTATDSPELIKLDSQKIVLDNILLELKDDINSTETVWYDKITPTLFYVRRSSTNQDTGIVTVSFYDVSGVIAAPIITNLVQVTSGIDYEFNSIERKANTVGIGYSIGDRIQELQILNMTLGTIVNTIWINKTANLPISAPPIVNVPIDDTYATGANQIAQKNVLDNLLLEKKKDVNINFTPLTNKNTGVVIVEKRSKIVETGVETIQYFNIGSSVPLTGIVAGDYNFDKIFDINITESLGYDSTTNLPYTRVLLSVYNTITGATTGGGIVSMLDSSGNNVGVLPTFVLGAPSQIGLAKESKQNAQLQELQDINNKLNTAVPLNVNVVNQIASTGGSTQYTLGTASTGNEAATAIFGLDTANGNRKGLYFDGTGLLVKDNQIGTDNTGVTQLNSGFGVRGWLSGIYKKVTDTFTNTSSWFTKLTDGVNNATIKASNISPVITDTALVTSLSPNGNTVKIGESEFKLSTLNNTTAQLLAGATFTGGIESALNFPQILVSLRNDLATTVAIKQYKDLAGTVEIFDYTGSALTYILPAGAGLNRAISVVGNYYRVVLTNNGVTASTNLDLQTYSGQFSTLPNITAKGSLPVAITEPLLTGGNTIGNTNQTLATAEFAKITNGTNTASVTAPNTSAVNADSGLVVQFHPNSAHGRVNVGQLNGNSIDTNTGVVGVGVQRFTIATDDALPVNLGAKNDTVATSDTGVFSLIALIKRLVSKIPVLGQAVMANSLPVTIASDQSDINPNRTITTASFNKITDGVNNATIKPATTAAIATDTAIVTTLSPNSATQNTSDASNGSVGAGVAGTKSSLAGLQFNTVAPTLATGQQASLQGDLNANLKVVSQPSTNIIGNIRIDQTTQGVTNFTTDNITQVSGVVNPITLPATTVAGLPIRQVPDVIGNTNTIASTIGTALFSKITSGVNTAQVIAGGVSIVGAIEPSLVVALSPNSASISTKLTDGTTAIPTILPNTPVPLNAPTLPVQISGNSPSLAPIAPSTVATRHEISGGQFLTTPPVLTNAQQAPLRLNSDGSLATGEVVKTVTQFGGFGVADVPITGSIKNISATNTTATFIYLQIHSTTTALTTGLVPLNGKSYRIPANSTVFFGTGDIGTSLITNCRIGLSTSFNTYTAVTLTATSFGVNIETI
jgi:hypothetical protein